MDKKGFTLIELMIVVAIIAIIAAIAIPNLIGARRTSNESAAMSTCKSFGSAAVAYSQTRPTQDYWIDTTADFTPNFTHVTPKGGYKFRYFANSAVAGSATKFVYLAVPVSTSTGQKSYYLDESQTIYVAQDTATTSETLTSAEVTLLNTYIDTVASLPVWANDDNTRITPVAGTAWVRK